MLINRGMIWAYFKEQQEESYCWGGMARSVAILLGVFFFYVTRVLRSVRAQIKHT